jgi:hypothetical protein
MPESPTRENLCVAQVLELTSWHLITLKIQTTVLITHVAAQIEDRLGRRIYQQLSLVMSGAGSSEESVVWSVVISPAPSFVPVPLVVAQGVLE